ISGYLKTDRCCGFVSIYLYGNGSSSPNTEGETFIAYISPSLDGSGQATFSQTLGGTWNNVSAVATVDWCGDGCIVSSEFSPKVAATNPLVVTNTNDSGVGSLRDVISF